MLQNDGTLKRVSYADALKEQNGDIPKEDLAVKLEPTLFWSLKKLKSYWKS